MCASLFHAWNLQKKGLDLMRTLVVFIILVVFEQGSFAAPTKNTTPPPPLAASMPALVFPQVESRVVIVEGRSGIFWPLPVAKRLLRDIKTCKKAVPLMRAVDARLRLEIVKSSLLLADSKLLSIQKQLLMDSTAKIRVSLREANAKLSVWYKSAVVWFVVGFVVSTAATTAVVLSLR